jgi:N-acetyl sugar amidotransferase
MKVCKKCIQPDTRPGIFFDDNGICGACLWAEEKKKIDWNSRYKELEDIALQAKENSKGNYDCAIGVSGGKDSTKQAIVARDELDLKCLLVNCEPENITDIGRNNIENLKRLGFDLITIRPNPKVMKKLIRYDFFDQLNPIKVTEFSLYSSTYIIAEKFKIPLIIQGENPGLTLGASLTGVGKNSNALKAEQLQTLSQGWRRYLNVEGIKENDLFLFYYNRKKLEDIGTKGIWLQYYLKEWSYRGNAEFSKNYGIQWRDESFDPNTIGSYQPFTSLDSDLNPVNQMLKYIKFGFGQCMDQACYDLRDGYLTREQAIDLVLKYDGKCSEVYIEKFCSYIGISQKEFWCVTEKFRGPMWKKDEKGNWYNTLLDILK